MTDKEKFEATFQRPTDFFQRSLREQAEIDMKLGLSGWQGCRLSEEEFARFLNHYDKVKSSEVKTVDTKLRELCEEVDYWKKEAEEAEKRAEIWREKYSSLYFRCPVIKKNDHDIKEQLIFPQQEAME